MDYLVDVAGHPKSDDLHNGPYVQYKEAVLYADTLADEWEQTYPGTKSDRSWASRDNMYAIRFTPPDSLVDWSIQVVRAE